jgi:hypothetical protein
VENSQTGIVFDPYYTDSLLRIFGGRPRGSRVISTRAPIPRGEVLTNLLLFGHAHLSYPYWLVSEFPTLDVLEREGLISWIPVEYYKKSLKFIESYSRCLDKFFHWCGLYSTVSLDATMQARVQQKKRAFEGIEEQLDLLSFYIDQLHLFGPLISSGLGHANLNSKSADWLFRRPVFFPDGSVQWVPTPEHSLLGVIFGQLLDETQERFGLSFSRYLREHIDRYNLEMIIAQLFYDLEYDRAAKIVKAEGVVLDTVLSMLAIESFALDTGNPVKVNAFRERVGLPRSTVMAGPDLYQLVQIQFNRLRYPVIETLDDILRLRDDPYLDNYRQVVFGYSRDLREALEHERFRVLERFKHDLERALCDISRSHRWATVLDVTFYLSIPLAIAGMLTGIPLSDIVSIPVGAFAKLASIRRNRRNGWLMFGRPGLSP